MKYIGEFKSINDRTYRIEIENKKSGTNQTLKLSETPFVTSISSEDKHIYSPIKCGGATVNILLNEYNPDFYANNSTSVKVTLYETTTGLDVVEWVGYVSPTIYTQGFDKYFEEISLDCVDGIAVLKDIKYVPEGKKEIRTFIDIIGRCLSKSNCYKTLYISDNVQLTSVTSSESVIEIFRISESALFDKKDDVTQPDEDVAWSCYDVLFQICQYLGYTLISEGDKVIILDYDAIRKGNNKYFKYTLNGKNLTNKTTETLLFSHKIEENSYKENGTNIEMSEIYNKVTVVDEFNALNEGEATTEGNLNITASSDPYFSESWIESQGIGNWYDVCDTITEVDEMGNNVTYQITVHRMHSERWYYTIVKYYDDPKFKFYRYSKNSPYTPQERTQDGAGYVMNSRGGTLCKYVHAELGDSTAWHNSLLFYNKDRLSSMTMEQRRSEWIRLLNGKLYNLNYKDCVVMMNGNQGNAGHISVSRWQDSYEYKKANIYDVSFDSVSFKEPYMDYPCVEYNDDNPAIFGSPNSYIKISGKVTTHDEWWNPWPMNNGADNEKLKYKKKNKSGDGMFIWAKLKWGDLWYCGRNGSGTWSTEERFFKLYWNNGIEGPGGTGTKKDGNNQLIWDHQRYNKTIFDKAFPLVENNGTNFVVGEEGYFIPCPTEGNLNGKIKLILYMPRDIWDNNDKRCDRYYTCVQCIEDFKIEGKLNTGGSLGDDSALDSDTVYTNLCENDSQAEMDEITFNICTFDNKNQSYSVVDFLDTNNLSHFLDKTFNKANYNGEGSSLRQEEHLIYKLVTQYTQPRLKFDCNLKLSTNPKLYGLFTDKTISDKTFIIEEYECDYKYNKINLKLIEKA
ncbi:MAG: hypothetical protein J1E16_06610 [Muribaculaceae bacterium]|nr:hypothetical protein [Muribaculaceae bacterium]